MEDLRDAIVRKRDGGEHSTEEIRRIVAAVAGGRAPEAQVAAWLMAVFCRGLTSRERADYAGAMYRSGATFDWSHLDLPTADKHSTGGVGDKVSLVWAPLMAAAGFAVPMISGRGLGHTGGTLDKLEAIPGYRCDLSPDEFRAAVAEVGCSITGQTVDLVPADRVLYDLRNRTGTVETVDHIAPSILSKKLAEGARHLVLDVKVGSGAFMKTPPEAERLARVMVELGEAHGRSVRALLTDMGTVLGLAAGNANEVDESLDALAGGGPPDLRALTVELGVEVLASSGIEPDGESARSRLLRLLDSGAAMERFERMVARQGGDLRAFRRRRAAPATDVVAPRGGNVHRIDALKVGHAVALLGGGRGGAGEAPDPSVGVTLRVAPGQAVQEGEPFATLHHRDGRGLEAARALLVEALALSPDPAPSPRPILGRVGASA